VRHAQASLLGLRGRPTATPDLDASRYARRRSQLYLRLVEAPLPLLPGGVRLLKGAGCVRCRGTGFVGRTGVFEIVTAAGELRDLIAREAPYAQMVEAARRSGMRTLREAAVRKLAQGLTAFDEVVRMTTV